MRAYLPCAILAVYCVASWQPALAQRVLIDPGANYQGFVFGTRNKAEVVIYAGVHDIDGKVAVCGLVFFGDNVSNQLRFGEQQLSRQVQYSLNGARLRVDTSRFKRYETELDALVGKAGCSVTEQPWQKAYAKMPLQMDTAGGTTYFRE